MSKKCFMAKTCFILATLVLSSCASPYLGRSVNMKSPAVCKSHTFPLKCEAVGKHFNVFYEVVALTGSGKYEVTGRAVYSEGTSKTWTDFQQATFILALIDHGVIVETITIYGGQGSFDAPITFSKNFETSAEFTATAMAYDMQVSG